MKQTISAREMATIVATSKDETRPALHSVHVTKNFTEATSGHIFVCAPREEMTDLAPGNYKFSAKAIKGKVEAVNFDNGIAIDGNHGTIKAVEGLLFPDTDSVIADVVKDSEKGTVTVGIDVKLLATIAKVINHGQTTSLAGHVTLEIPIDDPTAPITVSTELSDSVGILMPLKQFKGEPSPIQKLKNVRKGKESVK